MGALTSRWSAAARARTASRCRLVLQSRARAGAHAPPRCAALESAGMEFRDYYKVLGVERAASAEQIKAAYRRPARKYHPEASKEPNAEAHVKENRYGDEV